MKALIDGDMIVHMACAAQQLSGDFGDGEGETVMFDMDEALRGAHRMIRNWTKGAQCSQSIVCFSEGKNFRKIIYPDYKANRKGVEKPKAYYDVKAELEIEHEVWAIEGLEADDLMGIAGSRDPGNYVVVSRDKDMMTIPGMIYNPDHHKKPVRVRKAIADAMWMKQTMTGDTVDNYPGIPSVGEKTAQEILENPHLIVKGPVEYFKRGPRKGQMKPPTWAKGSPCSLWNSMISYGERYGVDEQHLITMARVARILRTGEFDTDNRVVKLWLPGGNYEELQLG